MWNIEERGDVEVRLHAHCTDMTDWDGSPARSVNWPINGSGVYLARNRTKNLGGSISKLSTVSSRFAGGRSSVTDLTQIIASCCDQVDVKAAAVHCSALDLQQVWCGKKAGGPILEAR